MTSYSGKIAILKRLCPKSSSSPACCRSVLAAKKSVMTGATGRKLRSIFVITRNPNSAVVFVLIPLKSYILTFSMTKRNNTSVLSACIFSQRPSRRRLHLLQCQTPQPFLDSRDDCWSHAQLVDAQRDQQRRGGGHAGEIAADADW